MKKINQILLGAAFLAVLYTTIFVFKKPHSLYEAIETYTTRNLELTFGSQSISSEHEQFIHQIAHKMGIDEDFTIRKMNWQALQIFGYHNAFVLQSMTFNFLPLVDKPYIFISQGFFEDLTVEEQTFLIGHELVHLKERHTRYLLILEIIGFTVLFILWWIYFRKYIEALLKTCMPAAYARTIVIILNLFAFIVCDSIPHLAALSYRRHIEWQADQVSLETLNSHDGGIKFLNRIEQEFKIPENNGYMDIFSDHPSNSLRKKYCTEHKHTITE